MVVIFGRIGSKLLYDLPLHTVGYAYRLITTINSLDIAQKGLGIQLPNSGRERMVDIQASVCQTR